jgi:hypothetical protein
MEDSDATDCQDEIDSKFSVSEPLGRGAGGIAVGCAAMNDMVDTEWLKTNLPTNHWY